MAFTRDKKIVTKERLSHLAESLPADWFMQIHRSYIISISKIESVGPGFVEINKKILPAGRNYKHKLTQLLGNNKS
jgi:DNA-binding LytR/AlgR family response regulator